MNKFVDIKSSRKETSFEMRQKGNNSNNTQIGYVGDHASVVVNNNNNFQNDVLLEFDETTARRVSKVAVKTEAKLFCAKTLGGVIIGCVPIIADIVGISIGFGISPLISFIICLIGGVFLAMKHHDSFWIYKNRPKHSNVSNFIGKNRIIQEDENRMYWLIYSRSADCIYSHCDGKIIVDWAPEREKKMRDRPYVGICSKCGREHSYRLDYNWVATKAPDMDWKPTENQDSNQSR